MEINCFGKKISIIHVLFPCCGIKLRRTFEASADDDVRDNTQIAHCENVVETSGLFDSQSQNGYSAKLDEQNHNKTVKRIMGGKE